MCIDTQARKSYIWDVNKNKEVKTMNNNIESLIKTNVTAFLADFKNLSQSNVNRIVEGEVKNPLRWGNTDGKDPVVVYYSNLESSNVMQHFIDHVHVRYGIYLKQYA